MLTLLFRVLDGFIMTASSDSNKQHVERNRKATHINRYSLPVLDCHAQFLLSHHPVVPFLSPFCLSVLTSSPLPLLPPPPSSTLLLSCPDLFEKIIDHAQTMDRWEKVCRSTQCVDEGKRKQLG